MWTRASKKHALQGARDHEEKGTVGDKELRVPESAEIRRTHHRGQWIGETEQRPWRGRDGRSWTEWKFRGLQGGESGKIKT